MIKFRRQTREEVQRAVCPEEGLTHHWVTNPKGWTVCAYCRKTVWDLQMEKPAQYRCDHPEYKDGRCAEMSCQNYINKHRKP